LFLCALLVPQSSEILANVASAQWHLALALLAAALICWQPESSAGKFCLTLALSIIALSTPLAAAFIPLFGLRLWLSRQPDCGSWRLSSFQQRLLMLLMLLGLIQLLTAALTYSNAAAASATLTPLDTLWRMLQRIVDPWRESLLLSVALPIAALAGLAWSLRSRGPARYAGLLLGAALGLTLATIFVKLLGNPRPLTVPVGGDRYFWIPRLLIITLCLLPLSGVSKQIQPYGGALALCVLLLLQAASHMPLQKPAFVDEDWPRRSLRAEWTLAEHGFAISRINPGLRCMIRAPASGD